jgi:hypothetical protein
MRARQRRRRVVVVPSGRRYVVCGLRATSRRSESPSRLAVAIFTGIPVSTLLFVMLVSVYAIGRPLPEQRTVTTVAAYSIDDFANVMKR